jgi:hypothetical protein
METSPFIRKVNECNLCTWYILPLIGLNKFSFNEANFINSYLTRDGQYIVVEVADRNLCGSVTFNSSFSGFKQKNGMDLLVFVIPGAWTRDVKDFMEGRYSQMSEYAKQLIRDGSGLRYDMPDEFDNRITDARLMALEKHPALRNQWLAELEVETPVKGFRLEIDDDTELLSIPSENSYIEI